MNNKPITSISRYDRIKRLLKGFTLVPLLCLTFAMSSVFAAEAEEGWSSEAMMEKVSLNNADADTLAQVLEGVGESKAQAIVAWREANGAFSSVDQLTEVKGIGAATVEKNRDKLTL